MAPKQTKAEKKISYDQKLCNLIDEYSQILIAGADNVGSKQLQNIRQGLRGDSVVLMGKNTMMKRTVRVHAEKTGNNTILNLIPLLVGNVGLIFTKGDLKEVSEEVSKYKVGAPARVGLVAPIDVVVQPGAVAVETEYSFPLADKVKEYLKDPSKFAVAAAPVAAAGGGSAPAAAKEEEKKEEPAEESDDDLGFGLFD